MHLLIVEDDQALSAGLQAALENAGFTAQCVSDAEQAYDCLHNQRFQAMLLDISLPGMDGLSLLKRLRSQACNLPVLMLTARNTTRDKVMCFEYGADDFLVKTTDIEELIARLRALIRRSGYMARLEVDDIVLDTHAQTASQNGQALNLSRREYELLRVLMEGAGQVLTRRQLEQALYGSGHAGESNVLEVHIHNLRQKIGDNRLKTIRGVGYSLLHQPDTFDR